jgi:hypothetical protein
LHELPKPSRTTPPMSFLSPGLIVRAPDTCRLYLQAREGEGRGG